ncbi:MAG: ABC transporter permease [Clostridia bacterium]|nr:ABC transporter permease [Clostridia bacterium]
MKRLTINRVAGANIRINRKAYVSLFIGILTAVFLATATSLCAWGTVRGHEEQMAQRVGWMDMFTLGSDEATDEQLRRCGFFQEIGHVTVAAVVEGKPVCAGYYDGTAERLMNRTLKEGRMPEKAGEIAAEQSALIRLDLEEAKVGDTLTLNMQPVYGVTEEKTFTLTGILNEQTSWLETYYDDDEYMRFPALLVFPEEQFKIGGSVVHRVLTYAPLITFNQVQRNCPVRMNLAFGVSRESGTFVYNDSGWDRAANTLSRILIWVVLGAALMLSACVGITSSMESLLARKTEDIGMLRAIGATKRQIRRVYGAEAWLLAVTALPAGLLPGVLFTRIVSGIAPDQVVFSLNGWLLVPILGLSVLCVFVASRVPLYHASRQMPMGVLRDTALLRKAGNLHSRKAFRPDRLIAGRRTRLHPLRQLGAAGMIALTLLSTLMLGELAMGIQTADDRDIPAFRLYSDGHSWSDDPFSELIPENTTDRAELKQLNAIDGVRQVRSLTEISVNLLMENVPEYFRTRQFSLEDEDGAVSVFSFGALQAIRGDCMDWLFWSGEDAADARARQDEDWQAGENIRQYDRMRAVRETQGISETPVPVVMYITDLDAAELREFVTDGTIDPDRLDSGEQVLVYAPLMGVRKENRSYSSEFFLKPAEVRENEWDMIIRNDVFTAGTALDLMELAGKEEENSLLQAEAADLKALYRQRDAVRARVTVGAVLSGPVRLCDTYMYSFSVITTPKGAEALGLKLPNPEYSNVWLDGDPTPEKEAEIEEKIGQVAMRGWLRTDNQLKLTREYRSKKLRQILLFAGLILLFFTVSVFMQVSGTSRQIRSETRTIGTLRAVGADLKTLVGCYRLPVIVCAAAGLVPCLLFYAVTEIPGLRLFTANHPAVMIPVLVLMAGSIVLACIAGIRSRIAGVTRQSIVDNIREL